MILSTENGRAAISRDISFVNSVKEFMGISGPHLTDTTLLRDLAESLDLPQSSVNLKKIERDRLTIRALESLSQLATMVGIACLGSSDILDPSGVFYSGLAALSTVPLLSMASGYFGTGNDSKIQTEMRTIAGSLSEANLGENGDYTAQALIVASSHSSEERMLGLRPWELVANQVLQWGTLIATSPEKVRTTIAAVSGIALSVGQHLAVQKLFTPANKAYIDAQREYIQNPNDPSMRRNLEIAVEKKQRATIPINGMSSFVQGIIMATSRLPINTLVTGLLSRFVGNFTSVAGRSSSINEATAAQKKLSELAPSTIAELATFINTETMLQAHKDKSEGDSHPADLADRLKSLNIHDAIVLDLCLTNVGDHQKGKTIKTIINFSPGHRIKYLVGDNGAGKTTLRRAITHEMDNHKGLVAVAEPADNDNLTITNLHAHSRDKLNTMFPAWDESQMRKRKGTFLAQSDLSQEQVQDIIQNIPDLSWILTDTTKYLSGDLSATHIMSEGERKILSIIAHVEKHKETAHTIWIDEAFAKIDPKKSLALKQYLELQADRHGCRFIVMQQALSTIDSTVVDDVIYLTRDNNYYVHVPGITSSVEAEIALGATSISVEENPLVKERIWETNPEMFVELLSRRHADALQLYLNASDLIEKFGVDTAVDIHFNAIRQGIGKWIVKKFGSPALYAENIIEDPNDLWPLAVLYGTLGELLNHIYHSHWNQVFDIVGNYINPLNTPYDDQKILIFTTSVRAQNGQTNRLSNIVNKLSNNAITLMVYGKDYFQSSDPADLLKHI